MVNQEQRVAVISSLTTGVIHPYVMNNATAKKKLLQNASKDPLTPGNVTQQSTKLSLSTGAFKETVIHLVSHWAGLIEQQHNLQLTVPQGQHTVSLVTLRDDGDKIGNKTDALVSFKFDDIEMKLHVYYTNQSLMVQGPSHASFYCDFLLPILTDLCSRKAQEIKDFNCMVIRTLKPGSLPEGCDDSVWRSSTPNRSNTLKMKRCQEKCDVCGKMFVDKSRLKVHKTNAHGANVALMSKPRTGIKSTRSILILTETSQHAQVRRQHMMNEATSVLEGNTTEDDNEDDLLLEESPSGQEEPPLRSKEQETSVTKTSSSTAPSIAAPRLANPLEEAGLLPLEETGPPLETAPDPQPEMEKPPTEINLEAAMPAPLEVIILTKSQVIPEEAWAETLNKSIKSNPDQIKESENIVDQSVELENEVVDLEHESDEIEEVDKVDQSVEQENEVEDLEHELDEIEEVDQAQPFECAVCGELFNDEESVKIHFETHGESESVKGLMKRICNLEMNGKESFMTRTDWLQVSNTRSTTSRISSPNRKPEPLNINHSPPPPSNPPPPLTSHQHPSLHVPRPSLLLLLPIVPNPPTRSSPPTRGSRPGPPSALPPFPRARLPCSTSPTVSHPLLSSPI